MVHISTCTWVESTIKRKAWSNILNYLPEFRGFQRFKGSGTFWSAAQSVREWNLWGPSVNWSSEAVDLPLRGFSQDDKTSCQLYKLQPLDLQLQYEIHQILNDCQFQSHCRSQKEWESKHIMLPCKQSHLSNKKVLFTSIINPLMFPLCNVTYNSDRVSASSLVMPTRSDFKY